MGFLFRKNKFPFSFPKSLQELINCKIHLATKWKCTLRGLSVSERFIFIWWFEGFSINRDCLKQTKLVFASIDHRRCSK